MADPGGAVLGAVASKILDELLAALKDLKDRDHNLQELEHLLQRLQPFVRNLQGSVQDESVHLATPWLDHLGKQLETARGVIQDCSKVKMGPCFRVRSSRKFKMLHDNIRSLLDEASIAQWATQSSTIMKLRDDVAVIKDEIQLQQEQRKERNLKIAEAVTFEPSSCRTRERIKRAVSEHIVPIHTQNDALSSSTSSSSASSSSTPLSRNQYWNRDCDTSEPVVSFGGDATAQQLISNLVNPERYRKWLGLWAAGGAGKTFTARKIYNNDRVHKHFTGGRYWVTVSKDQAPIHRLLEDLCACLGGKDKFPDSLADAQAVLKEQLDREKVLLILDDVWDPRTLEHLDLVSHTRRSVILITTRDDNNLRNAMDSGGIFQIPPLSKEDSWKLFSWHAFLAHKKDVRSDLEDVARAVADECKGLPLALQVIGSTMADIRLFDREVRHLDKSLRQEWEDALEKLRRANVGEDEYEALYRRLQLSVDNLNEEDPRLQDCFFYFAAFPEDYEVDMLYLVSIWIAEGIVGNEQDNLASREKEGIVLIGLLVSKSMIELIPYRDMSKCRIHDVMRDLAHRNLQWKVGEKRVKIETSKRTCLYAPGLKAKNFPEEWTDSSRQHSVKRLSFHSNDLEQLHDQFVAPYLRVLILAHNSRLQALPPGFFKSLSQLTVLDLSFTRIKKVSGKFLRSLKLLVLLNLTSCAWLQKISDRIGDLQNLQSIFLYRCDNLVKLPRMKRLTKLHTLSMIQGKGEDDEVTGCVNKLVSKCNGGSDFVPCFHLKNDLEYEMQKVLDLRNLKRLSINAYKWPLFDVSPLVALEYLFIESKEFPKGMSKLRNLKSLKIWRFDGNSIPALEKLPLLESLEINHFGPDDLAFPDSFGRSGAFPSLKKMQLHRVEICTLYHGAMPRIQTLKMWDARRGDIPPSLKVFGSSLNFLGIGTVHDDVDLEQVFSEPDKFLNLEYLELRNVDSLPETIACLPRLRWLGCSIDREKLPQNLTQLENQGKLEIV